MVASLGRTRVRFGILGVASLTLWLAAGEECSSSSSVDLQEGGEGEGAGDATSLIQLRRGNQNQTSGFVITTPMVVGAASAAAGTLATKALVEGASALWGQVAGQDDFASAVGSFGLPISVGVVNNGDKPVVYKSFEITEGTAWGMPALRKSLKTGEMMEWFLYTRTTNVVASILLEEEAGGNSWAIGVEQRRMGQVENWGCDKMRTKVVRNGSFKDAHENLCKTLSGSGAGVQVSGGYEVVFFLKEAGLE